MVLSRAEVERSVSLKVAMVAVEGAFIDLARGDATVFPVIREHIDPYGGFFGVKAGYLASAGILGYKGGGFWASNRARGKAAHQSVILLYNPETGEPLAAIDGNYVTIIRTGAAGALAARVLARPESRVAAVIGAGVQGQIQLEGLCEVLPIEEARCFDANSADDLAQYAVNRGLKTTVCRSAEQAVEGADVVVTATPSFAPLLGHVAPGTHINAFGADTRGKQELDPALVARSRLVVDYLPQAREIGESQHAFRSGLIAGVHAELGEILAGTKPGRSNAEEITIFDATGIALQDLAVAAVAYRAAVRDGVGIQIEL
jgi:ornithine cyclodeaminase/alanine dehydrogenase-like protein (mu-crystallin family)